LVNLIAYAELSGFSGGSSSVSGARLSGADNAVTSTTRRSSVFLAWLFPSPLPRLLGVETFNLFMDVERHASRDARRVLQDALLHFGFIALEILHDFGLNLGSNQSIQMALP
jgi:hypothetical protein